MTPARRLAFLALCSLLMTGCGQSSGDTPLGADDAGKVELLVSMVNDDKSTGSVLSRHFAKGSVPKDLKKYPRYTYDVVGKPTLNGDTATAKVKLTAEIGGKEAGDQEWTFVKEGDAWKIKSAPLP
jgi:hypothetical protein